MCPVTHDQTLFLPKPRSTSFVDRATTGLAPHLVNRAATRLQTLAWLYAFTCFMAAFFLPLLFPVERRVLFESPVNWAPGVISISVAVSVALAGGPKLHDPVALASLNHRHIAIIHDLEKADGDATLLWSFDSNPDCRGVGAPGGHRPNNQVHRRIEAKRH